MPDQALSAFVFGKLPAHGDFVVRGLDPACRARWDAWLAGELAQARAALGEAFDGCYHAAPVWRFAIVDADGWCTGALAASLDAVGRRFPLLVGVRGVASVRAAEQSEEALYDALSGGWDADTLFARVSAIGPGGGDAVRDVDAGWWTPGNAEHAPMRVAGAFPDGLLAAMLTPTDMSAARTIAIRKKKRNYLSPNC